MRPGNLRAYLVDRRQVELAPHLGLVDRVRKLLLGQNLSEVHEGPGHAGGRDAVDLGAVLGLEAARAVQDEAVVGATGTRGRHLDSLRRLREVVGGPSGAVAAQRLGATGEHGGQLARAQRERQVADRVDAAMEAVQAPVGHPAGQAAAIDGEPVELPDRNHAELAPRKPRNRRPERVRAELSPISECFSAHTPSLAPGRSLLASLGDSSATSRRQEDARAERTDSSQPALPPPDVPPLPLLVADLREDAHRREPQALVQAHRRGVGQGDPGHGQVKAAAWRPRPGGPRTANAPGPARRHRSRGRSWSPRSAGRRPSA